MSFTLASKRTGDAPTLPSIDGVKDLPDKAMAFEVYARQAQNVDAVRKACEIRLRAERRTGELLKDLQRASAPNGVGKNQRMVTSNDAT